MSEDHYACAANCECVSLGWAASALAGGWLIAFLDGRVCGSVALQNQVIRWMVAGWLGFWVVACLARRMWDLRGGSKDE